MGYMIKESWRLHFRDASLAAKDQVQPNKVFYYFFFFKKKGAISKVIGWEGTQRSSSRQGD